MSQRKILIMTTSVAALLTAAMGASAQKPNPDGPGGANPPSGGATTQEPSGGKGGAPAGAVTPRGEAKGFDRGAPGTRGLGDDKREAQEEDGEPGKKQRSGKQSREDKEKPSKGTTEKRAGEELKKRDADRSTDRERRSGEEKVDRKTEREKVSPKTGDAAKIDVKPEKKAELKQRVNRTSLQRSTNIDIDINVGVTVPRRVVLHTLPSVWLTIVPEYEGYRYIYLEDVICIVDPETFVIVDVIYI